ncbi:DUF397 domain-containing protein [Actinacidiphila sp. bgisy145]|uniref:DUF397 domain-containing protein n=1 Tax=Actinacidiphila sp. bgisy145 TaxID=3413792 RepID=UPI003EBB4B55
MHASGLDGAVWRKSSHSGGDSGGGQCVEFAELSATAAVRDSKDPQGPVLTFSTTEWASFVTALRADEFPTA